MGRRRGSARGPGGCVRRVPEPAAPLPGVGHSAREPARPSCRGVQSRFGHDIAARSVCRDAGGAGASGDGCAAGGRCSPCSRAHGCRSACELERERQSDGRPADVLGDGSGPVDRTEARDGVCKGVHVVPSPTRHLGALGRPCGHRPKARPTRRTRAGRFAPGSSVDEHPASARGAAGVGGVRVERRSGRPGREARQRCSRARSGTSLSR